MAPLAVVLQIAGLVESVGVVAPKLEEELPQIIERTGVRAQTITAAEIQNGGYYDVAQALQALVPGLFLTPRAGPFDYVTASLQGSRTNEILWLVDGVRISNRLYNGTTPLDTIPAHMVERIEILEGGQGLFYGTQAVAGVINVVTKAFTDSTDARAAGRRQYQRGRFRQRIGPWQRAGQPLRALWLDRRCGRLTSCFRATSISPVRPTAIAATTSTRSGAIRLRFLPAAAAQRRVSVHQRRPARQPPTRAVGCLSVGRSVEHLQRTEREHLQCEGRFHAAPRRREFFFKGYYHRWDSHYTEEQNVIGEPGAVNVVSDQEFWGYKDYGANLLAKLTPTRGVEYYAGYDFQNYSGEDDVLLIAPNTETVNALFGQIRTTRDLIHNVTLTAGVRFNAPSESENHTVWNVTGQYDLPKALFARATVGTSFRYPDAYELFAIDPFCCFGNPNLKPESSTNFNGSFGGRIQRGETTVDLEFIGFYRKMSDLIIDVDDGTGSGNTITDNSTNAVRVHGFELVGSASLTSAVATTLGYTYTTSEQGQHPGGRLQFVAGSAFESRERVGGSASRAQAVRRHAHVLLGRRHFQQRLGVRPGPGWQLRRGRSGRPLLPRRATAASVQRPAREPVRCGLRDGKRTGFPRRRRRAVSHEAYRGSAAHPSRARIRSAY